MTGCRSQARPAVLARCGLSSPQRELPAERQRPHLPQTGSIGRDMALNWTSARLKVVSGARRMRPPPSDAVISAALA